MAEVINTKVFDATKKFVDLSGLDYFWEKAKAYVDGVDSTLTDRIAANETAISNIQDELDSLSGGAGSIDTQITNKINALDVDEVGGEGKYVSAIKQVDGKIEATVTDLPDYTDVYDAKGSAAQALVDAKAYTDELANGAVKTNTDAIATLNGTGEGSVDAKITAAFNDFSSKVSDDAVVNTYKELIDYAAEHGAEFTELVGVVAKKANADDVYTKTAADAAFDAKGSAAQALVDAEAYADGLNTAMDTRVKVLEAIDHDAYKAADTALETSLKGYTDTEVAKVVADLDALEGVVGAAKTDTADATGIFKIIEDNEKVTSEALTDLNTRVNANADAITVLNGDDTVEGSVAKAKAEAIAAAKADADTKLAEYYKKTEVDTLLSENSVADQAYAKTYTDQLFDSIGFASTTDIDGIFAVAAE